MIGAIYPVDIKTAQGYETCPAATVRVPVLPPPEDAVGQQPPQTHHERAQERLQQGLINRIVSVLPPALFSWQAVVLGAQTLACTAGIVLTVLSSAGAPILALAGIGLAIAIADLACLIYHQKHTLPMEHDSIANAVFFIAQRFMDEQRSQDVATAASLGGRLLLMTTTIGQVFWCGFLRFDSSTLKILNEIASGLLVFSRYGLTGISTTGMQVSGPFLRLISRHFSQFSTRATAE